MKNFLKKLVKMSAVIKDYFSGGTFKKHCFKVIGFSSKEYATIKIIAFSKKKNAKVWYFNNLIFPFLVIYVPYVATVIHRNFNTISFNKTIVDLTITGSLSLLGLNVLRSASTYISEKLDESKIPSEFTNSIDVLKSELSSIKSTLKTWVFSLTVFGTIIYIIQVIQLINGTSNIIYIFIFSIISITALSILAGRFIYLLETNFLDNDEVIRLLFKVVNNQNNDFKKLEDKINQLGL